MKKILAIVTVMVFMLSLMPLTAASNGVPIIQMGKMESDLRTMIQEQSGMDLPGALRVVVVLNERC